jgi:hypothetical protein
LVLVLAAVGAVVVVAALAAFEPWTLVTDTTVDEALPGSSASSPGLPTPSAPAGGRPAASPSIAPTGEPLPPVELARGTFVSHEHRTSGTARVLELADGGRVLRLEGLDTSNGPDLHVWLAAAPVVEGRAGWFVFDDDDHVDLGSLKGNQGDQNYLIPPDADLEHLSSVAIWCERFHVSFGAAALT